ncbi:MULTISPECIES: hypothetical protein [unclassified Sphingomonas]|uniref:hypothetical protein n=1 Tax=Novosphingobium rhizosphaerae TaxID=1551649 RepID=UPI0015C82D51
MADSSVPSRPPSLPPGWIWYDARLPDGREHRFAHAVSDDHAALLARAWAIWSPARAGRDGRFLAPGLLVQAAMEQVDRFIPL